MSEKEVVYFGFDESNHAGENTKGEIVVCAYSFDHKDSLVDDWPNRRSYSKVEKWLNQPNHDFRFTILTGEEYKYKSSSTNLTEATPNLVLNILTNPKAEFDIPKDIKLYFDGCFGTGNRNFLKNNFKKLGIEKVVVGNFIKKNKNKKKNTRKAPQCPNLVYIADVLANHLYNIPIGDLLNHPHFIPHQRIFKYNNI